MNRLLSLLLGIILECYRLKMARLKFYPTFKVSIGLWMVDCQIHYRLESSVCAIESPLSFGQTCLLSLEINITDANPKRIEVTVVVNNTPENFLVQINKPSVSIGSNYVGQFDLEDTIIMSSIGTSQVICVDIKFDSAFVLIQSVTKYSSGYFPQDDLVTVNFGFDILPNFNPSMTNTTARFSATVYDFITGTPDYWSFNGTLTVLPTPSIPKPDFSLSQVDIFTTNLQFSSLNHEIERGRYYYFTVDLFIQTIVYVDLQVEFELVNTGPINAQICSAYLKWSGSCFQILNGVKEHIKYNKYGNNLVVLNFGNITNKDNTICSDVMSQSSLTFVFAIKVDVNSPLGTFDWNISPLFDGVRLAFTAQTVTVVDPGVNSDTSIPSIGSSLEPEYQLSVYSPFFILLDLQIPTYFSSSIELNIVPVQNTPDGSARVKMVSSTVIKTGYNLPCECCLNQDASLHVYAQNTTSPGSPDSLKFNVTSIFNFNTYSPYFYKGANNLTLQASGLVVPNSMNVNGSNVTLLIGVNVGNRLVWVDEQTIYISGPQIYEGKLEFATWSQGAINLHIRDQVSFVFGLYVTANFVLETTLTLSCVDKITGRVFCSFDQLSLIQIGRNLKGFGNPLTIDSLNTTFSRRANDAFYNDTVVIDLGSIFNSFNVGNDYQANSDDRLAFNCSVLIVDDAISYHSNNLGLSINASFNQDQHNESITQEFVIERTGDETPFLVLDALIEDNYQVFYPQSEMIINFELSHADNSTAEAYNVSVVFYFTKFLLLNSLNCSRGVNSGVNESSVFLQLNRLHFGEVLKCTLITTVDPLNQYENFLRTISGISAVPGSVTVPYGVNYEKYPRTLPAVETTNWFKSPLKYLGYTPSPAYFDLAPEIPFWDYLDWTNEPCRLSSSVPESTTTELLNKLTGWWIGDYRSKYWYMFGGTYAKIAFGDRVNVSVIELSQLPPGPFYDPFTKFQISFSYDDISYAFFSPVQTNTNLGDSFNYTIPNGPVELSYLRVHILDTLRSSQLDIYQTGLSVSQIYGTLPPSFVIPISHVCAPAGTSPYYDPRSYLYVPTAQTLFVCDQNYDRESNECYFSIDNSPDSWTVLPSTVSTIVFWLRDINQQQDYLFGVGRDRKTYVRSNDMGFSWYSISSPEFNALLANKTDSRYLSSYYNPLANLYSPVVDNFWSFHIRGVKFNNDFTFNWFD